MTVQPRDAVWRCVYIAPLGLYITVDAGVITEFTFSSRSGEVGIQLADVVGQNLGTVPATSAVVKYKKPASVAGSPDIQLDTAGL